MPRSPVGSLNMCRKSCNTNKSPYSGWHIFLAVNTQARNRVHMQIHWTELNTSRKKIHRTNWIEPRLSRNYFVCVWQCIYTCVTCLLLSNNPYVICTNYFTFLLSNNLVVQICCLFCCFLEGLVSICKGFTAVLGKEKRQFCRKIPRRRRWWWWLLLLLM